MGVQAEIEELQAAIAELATKISDCRSATEQQKTNLQQWLHEVARLNKRMYELQALQAELPLAA